MRIAGRFLSFLGKKNQKNIVAQPEKVVVNPENFGAPEFYAHFVLLEEITDSACELQCMEKYYDIEMVPVKGDTPYSEIGAYLQERNSISIGVCGLRSIMDTFWTDKRYLWRREIVVSVSGGVTYRTYHWNFQDGADVTVEMVSKLSERSPSDEYKVIMVRPAKYL